MGWKKPLKYFLTKHDGIIFTWSRQRYVYPIKLLVKLISDFKVWLDDAIKEFKADGVPWRENFFYELPYDNKIWKIDLFFPFGLDASGNTHCFYVGAKIESGEIPIFKYDHNGYFKLINSSFANFLWYLNIEGHTHPQEYDTRTAKFQEKDIKLIFKK